MPPSATYAAQTAEFAPSSNDRCFAPWPYFAPDEMEAALHVLSSGKINYWTGNECREFEREYAEHTGTRHAIALANGTVALELALRVCGVGPGDDVVTTPRTFIASASSAVAVGARPIFADVDADNQSITAETIAPVLTPATKAIIAVHLAGWPCDIENIVALAGERGIAVIEDCAQAHGAAINGARVGSLGDIGAFSFCQDKILTTAGEGGMITLNSDEKYEQAWAYKDHGKSFDAVYRRKHAPGFRWLHESFGTNWRLSEIQAAIGRVQLRKLPDWVDKRREHAAIFDECFSTLETVRVTRPPQHIEHAYYKYYAFVRPEGLRPGWDRDRIVAAIASRGVPCFSGSCSEIYLEKAFPPAWRPPKRLPVAQRLGETSIMFLVHPTLTPEDIDMTCEVARAVLQQAAR